MSDQIDVEANVRAHVVDVAAALNRRLTDITVDMREVLATRIGELNGDELLLDLLGASIEGNVRNILDSLQHGIPLRRVEPPSAAFEYARRLAQHGVPVNALVRAYRLGQQNLMEAALAESCHQLSDPATQLPAFDQIVTHTFDYIDWISQQVIVVYEQERERWLASRDSTRSARVVELLADDEPVDLRATEATLGYRLDNTHIGAVLWADDGGAHSDQLQRLSNTASAIASVVGSGPLLVVPQDKTSVWAWIAVDGEVEFQLSTFRDSIPSEEPQPMIAIGTPQRGVDGFRRTHREALDTQRVAVLGRSTRSLTSYDEPGVGIVALLSRIPTDTSHWVRNVLADLSTNDDQHARLRETLYLFYRNGSSYTATGEAMTMHKNSVKYRIASAEKALGHSVHENRQEVELALTVMHWLGPEIVHQAGSST